MKKTLYAIGLALAITACGTAGLKTPDAVQAEPGLISVNNISAYYKFSSSGDFEVVSGTEIVDGERITDGRLYLHNVKTGNYFNLTETSRFGQHFYANGGEISPDGSTVYTFILSDSTWKLYAINTSDGSTKEILAKSDNGPAHPEGKTLSISGNGKKLAFRGYDIESVDNEITAVHSTFVLSLDSLRATSGGNGLVGERLTTPTLTSPVVNDAGAVTYTKELPFEVVNQKLGPSAIELGMIGRLPYDGDGVLTGLFHGSGERTGSYGKALDLVPSRTGAAVRSITAGRVVSVNKQVKADGFTPAGCGQYLVVDHSNTTYDTYYCHMAYDSPAYYGIYGGSGVSAGTPLGTFSNTGEVYSSHGGDGSHIHLAVIANVTFGLYGRINGGGDCKITTPEWAIGVKYSYVTSPC